MSKRILVTGGTGYIGSHTAIALIESGYEVIVFDDLSNSDIVTLDRVEEITGVRPVFHKVDVSDIDALRGAFDEIGSVDGIIHFAAKKAVGESVAQPLMYYKINVLGLINVLQVIEERGLDKLIFSSSATVYGQPDRLPVDESSPTLPAESPYGNTKQIGEEIIEDQVKAQGGKLHAISLRYFNPVGAHASGLNGELPLGTPNNLMPYITQTGIGLREQLSVFGSDYNTKDGTAIRDYIHVVDLSDAHVVALERLIQKANADDYEIYNLGTGCGSTVLEVIQSFEKMSGLALPYVLTDRRPGDVESIYADPTKANEVLGWKANYTLDDMTKTAWEWEKYYRNTIAKE